MRFAYAAVCLSILWGFAGFAATTATKSTGVKKATSKKAGTPSSVKKAPASASTRSKSAKSKSTRKVVPAATWRNRQQVPTPDRYKEIQQALVDKGYLKGEPSGVWDADSEAAMARFQTDQKLTATGKITAPSLIGLGLGAKSAGAPEAAPLGGAPAPASAGPGPSAPDAGPEGQSH